MNQATQNLSLQGAAGVLEALLDEPAEGVAQGTAFIAHPHP
jgi:alpha/beta superfamily hydrolase